MAKPTEDPKWVTSEDPQHIIEPTAPQKINGILSGGIWTREYLNWMFFAISKWIDWVRSNAMDKDSNLSDLENKVTAFGEIKQDATTTVTGVVALATGSEVATGTDSNKAITPSTLLSRTSTATRTGVIQLATEAEVQAGSDSTKAITPATLYSNTATGSRRGVVELATDTETQTGTDTTRAITPANLSSRTATTTRTGLVEKATQAEMDAGTAERYPDAATVKTFVDDSDWKAILTASGFYYEEVITLQTSSGDLSSGDMIVTKVGRAVTISGKFNHSSSTSVTSATALVPSWARPAATIDNVYGGVNVADMHMEVKPDGTLIFTYSSASITTTTFPISYNV